MSAIQNKKGLLTQCTEASRFTGHLKHKVTGETKLCDDCKVAEATWIHVKKKDGGYVYLCFGCGNH